MAETSRYYPVGSVVFAARLRGGWVGSGGFEGLLSAEENVDIVHPQKRFYTGGANSVRGYPQSGLGPRVLFASPEILLSSEEGGGGCTVAELEALTCVPAEGTSFVSRPTGGTRVFEANAELRFPVGSLFEGVVFGDVGQAWGRDESIDISGLEASPGVGVRIPSPVGPIRIDLAYRFGEDEALAVVTEQIEVVDGMTSDWESTGQLVRLISSVPFGLRDSGLQLHVSIGQAF